MELENIKLAVLLLPLELSILKQIEFLMLYLSKYIKRYVVFILIIDLVITIFLYIFGFSILLGIFWMVLMAVCLFLNLSIFTKLDSQNRFKSKSVLWKIDSFCSIIIGIVIWLIPYISLGKYKLFLIIGGGINYKIDILSRILFFIAALSWSILNGYVVEKIMPNCLTNKVKSGDN